jgi:hypothetical protein
VRARARGGAGGCVIGFSRRKKAGGAHMVARGESEGGWAGRRPRPGGRGRWLGLGRGRRPNRGGGSGPVADRMGRAEKEKEAGPKPFLGLKSNRVKKINFN